MKKSKGIFPGKSNWYYKRSNLLNKVISKLRKRFVLVNA